MNERLNVEREIFVNEGDVGRLAGAQSNALKQQDELSIIGERLEKILSVTHDALETQVIFNNVLLGDIPMEENSTSPTHGDGVLNRIIDQLDAISYRLESLRREQYRLDEIKKTQ